MKKSAPPRGGGVSASQNVFILCPFLKQERRDEAYQSYRLSEAVGLAGAISLNVIDCSGVKVDLPKPATLFGKGMLEDLQPFLDEKEVNLVYVDGALSPIQQRNLEKILGCKVIDRTALILEIFGARAKTAEGVLQVELAALNYQRSRLVRSWTHLERQRGGFGFLGGPGESQLEIDRRLIGVRIARLKKELEHVIRTRTLQRRSRQKVPYPVVALVGYTNAGKSTLFNRLTGAEAVAQDLPFLTLDPLMRMFTLPSGMSVILSDTVGFISDLPTHLVAAFRATLEEVVEADIVLHVRDISSPMLWEHGEIVDSILRDLGLSFPSAKQGYVEVFNKSDQLNGSPLRNKISDYITTQGHSALMLSAVTGEGVVPLLSHLDMILGSNRTLVSLEIPSSDGKFISWLHEYGVVMKTDQIEDKVVMDVSLDPKTFSQMQIRFKGQYNVYDKQALTEE